MERQAVVVVFTIERQAKKPAGIVFGLYIYRERVAMWKIHSASSPSIRPSWAIPAGPRDFIFFSILAVSIENDIQELII
jgi:hypothetical protein